MQWFLIVYVYGCVAGGINSGMIPENCLDRQTQLAMPAHEVCQQISALNPGTECWGKDAKQSRLGGTSSNILPAYQGTMNLFTTTDASFAERFKPAVDHPLVELGGIKDRIAP